MSKKIINSEEKFCLNERIKITKLEKLYSKAFLKQYKEIDLSKQKDFGNQLGVK
jgi:hypothetical protein